MTQKDQYTVLWSNCFKTKTFLSGYAPLVHFLVCINSPALSEWLRHIPASWICIFISSFTYWSSAFLVKLAACRSLCLHVEDANFSEREFIDLLPVCWVSCFKLVEEVQEFDSKVKQGFCITFVRSTARPFVHWD